jgi:hypothetical protein
VVQKEFSLSALVSFAGAERSCVVEVLTRFFFSLISSYSANTSGFHDEGDCCHPVVAQ